MQIEITGEMIAIITGALGLIGAYTTGTIKTIRKLDRVERSQKIAEAERPKRKREIAMIFRYLISVHDGLKKCGYVNGDLDQHRKTVEIYIDENWGGEEIW